MFTRRRKLSLLVIAISAVSTIAAFLCWHNSLDRRLQRELAAIYERPTKRDARVRFSRDDTQAIREFEAVLRGTGTNAIPVLLSWIDEANKPSSTLKLYAQRLGTRFTVRSVDFWLWVTDDARTRRGHMAATTFRLFKPEADCAVPRLKEIAHRSDPTGYARKALVELGESPYVAVTRDQAHEVQSFGTGQRRTRTRATFE